MKYLDYAKKYTNFDIIVVLLDELNFTDEQIMEKLAISKQSIYNAQNRMKPLMDALGSVTEQQPVEYGNPDINQVIEAFKRSFGTTSASRYDRFAAKRLNEKHGVQKILAIITALANLAGVKYAPTINSISDLEKKWVSIGKFLNTQAGKVVIEL